MSLPADSQDIFGSAIRDSGISAPAGLIDTPEARATTRFNIYRNNHVVGLADALSHTFPVVQQLVGQQFFQSAAIAYVREHPPTSPVLLLYGEQFADFLANLPGVASVRYVADVARLEWARVYSLNAVDIAPAHLQQLSNINPEALSELRFEMHPSLRLLSSGWPVLSIWKDCQCPSGEKIDITIGERLMLVRSGFDVSSWLLTPGEYEFVQSLFNGKTLREAAESATRMDTDFDLAQQLGLVFQRGAVAGFGTNQHISN